MSLRQLFRQAWGRILRERWGTRIQQADGTEKDTGVQKFAEELAAIFASEEPIVIDGPIKIERTGNHPVFEVVNNLRLGNTAIDGSDLQIGDTTISGNNYEIIQQVLQGDSIDLGDINISNIPLDLLQQLLASGVKPSDLVAELPGIITEPTAPIISQTGGTTGPDSEQNAAEKALTAGDRTIILFGGSEDKMIAVSVIGQAEDAEYKYTYNCYLLDINGALTDQEVRVMNTLSDDLLAGAVSRAWKSENGAYWMKLSAEDAAVVSEEVDFIVDMFDRADANNLGNLWYGSDNFRIADEIAYCTDSAELTIYTTKLSGHDYIVKIWFNEIESTSNYFRYAGLAWGAKDDYSDSRTYRGSLQRNIPSPQWVRSIDSNDVLTNEETVGWVSGEYPLELNDPETASIQTSGQNVDIEFVGVVSEGTAGPYRQKVGLYHYSGANVIKFKAWVSSIPEPPDESGHGTYSDGVYTYIDKYHANGGYNPNA